MKGVLDGNATLARLGNDSTRPTGELDESMLMTEIVFHCFHWNLKRQHHRCLFNWGFFLAYAFVSVTVSTSLQSLRSSLSLCPMSNCLPVLLRASHFTPYLLKTLCINRCTSRCSAALCKRDWRAQIHLAQRQNDDKITKKARRNRENKRRKAKKVVSLMTITTRPTTHV